MSLAKLPLRIATVLALRGETWVGDAVFDSSITPMDDRVRDEKGLPFLVVYTDDAHAESRLDRDLTGLQLSVDLIIHAALATDFRGTEAGTEVMVARSDAGFEAQLDVIEAQILRTLQRGTSDWCELWRAFAPRHGEVRSRRGASARKGARFAAREIVLPLETVADPSGEGPEFPWNIAADVFGAHADTIDLAEILRSFMNEGVGLPDWQRLYRTLGMDAATARSLSFAAADGDDFIWL